VRLEDVTIVQINDYKFYMEPRLLFINGRRYFFRELADGGLVYWALDMDNEKVEVTFLEHHFQVVQKLNQELMERLVLNEQEGAKES